MFEAEPGTTIAGARAADRRWPCESLIGLDVGKDEMKIMSP